MLAKSQRRMGLCMTMYKLFVCRDIAKQIRVKYQTPNVGTTWVFAMDDYIFETIYHDIT
jgi:hypothetical protein